MLCVSVVYLHVHCGPNWPSNVWIFALLHCQCKARFTLEIFISKSSFEKQVTWLCRNIEHVLVCESHKLDSSTGHKVHAGTVTWLIFLSRFWKINFQCERHLMSWHCDVVLSLIILRNVNITNFISSVLVSSELSALSLVTAVANWVALQHNPVHHSCNQSQHTQFRWNEVR